MVRLVHAHDPLDHKIARAAQGQAAEGAEEDEIDNHECGNA